MRRGVKPYNKRKIFKRKSGGSKFFLGRKSKFDFPASQMPKDPLEGLMGLIQLILGQQRPQIAMRTQNK